MACWVMIDGTSPYSTAEHVHPVFGLILNFGGSLPRIITMIKWIRTSRLFLMITFSRQDYMTAAGVPDQLRRRVISHYMQRFLY